MSYKSYRSYKSYFFTVVLALSFFFVLPFCLNAQSSVVSYSGRLLDSTGNIVNSAGLSMKFLIYSDAVGGTLLYQDWHDGSDVDHPLVPVQDGLYKAKIGDDTTDHGGASYTSLIDALKSDDTVFLQIIIDGTSLSPREQLHSSPYAISANFAGNDYANKALDNIESVAVSENITPKNDNSINIGSAAKAFADIYLDGNLSDGTNTRSPANFALVNGAQTWTNKTINATLNNIVLDEAKILIGNAGNSAQGQSISGDIAVSDTGLATIQPNSVALGTDTTGDYVATFTAGDGLSGSSSGEGSNPTVAVNVDNSTIEIDSDTLRIKDLGVTTAKLANNAVETAKFADANVTNAKLASSSVTVTAGDGLKDGGEVSLGAAVTINVDPGDGIQISGDKVAVDNTVVRTSGEQTVNGIKTFSNLPFLPARNPRLPNQMVRKGYIDELTSGLSWHEPCKAATVSNITLSGEQTVDGVALVAGDRCLVKNQTDATENGIYDVAVAAWSRSDDMNEDDEFKKSVVMITEGTVNDGTAWGCNNTGDITVGTTEISFVKISQSGARFAGDGLTLDGNSISIAANASSGITVNSNDIQLNVAGVTLEIATNALQIKNSGVSNAKFANDAVTLGTQTTGNYVATIANAGGGTITVAGSGSENANVTVNLADNSVSTVKIQNDAVTNTKMADNSVNTAEIVNNAVTTAKIADKNVTLAKFADGGANQVLTTDASGAAQWQNKTIFVSPVLPTNQIYAGDASNTAVATANLPPQALPTGGNWNISSNLNVDSNTLVVDRANDRIGIGIATPTAALNLKAGTAAANTAPLKFTEGTDTATAEDGALEFSGGNLKFTRDLWQRKNLAFADAPPQILVPTQFSYFFDDFDEQTTTAMVWTTDNATGTQAVGAIVPTDNALGFLQFSTGAAAAGRSCLYKAATGFLLGVNPFHFETRVRITTLSTAAQEFGFVAGLHDDVVLNPVDGVYFLYDRLNYGTNWQCVTSSNSTRTVVNSGIAIAANTWYRLGCTVNASGTTAYFYVNGVRVATVTTNIPTDAGRETGPRILLLKSAGGTSRTADIDYWLHKIVYPTPR